MTHNEVKTHHLKNTSGQGTYRIHRHLRQDGLAGAMAQQPLLQLRPSHPPWGQTPKAPAGTHPGQEEPFTWNLPQGRAP